VEARGRQLLHAEVTSNHSSWCMLTDLCRDSIQKQCRNQDQCSQTNPCSPYSCPGYDNSTNKCPVNWQNGQLYAQNLIASPNSLYTGCYLESCNRQCRSVPRLLHTLKIAGSTIC
jgi:hypothetical protein